MKEWESWENRKNSWEKINIWRENICQENSNFENFLWKMIEIHWKTLWRRKIKTQEIEILRILALKYLKIDFDSWEWWETPFENES